MITCIGCMGFPQYPNLNDRKLLHPSGTHLITSSNGGRSVESSLRGPEVRVLIMEASRLNRGPHRGVAFEDTQATPTSAPPTCSGSFGGRASVNNCRERSISAVALLERRRWRQFAMWPLQAVSSTPTDRRIDLQATTMSLNSASKHLPGYSRWMKSSVYKVNPERTFYCLSGCYVSEHPCRNVLASLGSEHHAGGRGNREKSLEISRLYM